MSIIENTKKIWRRSIQKSTDLTNGTVDKGNNLPITLAVIGCGQRGDVSCFHYCKCTDNITLVNIHRTILYTRWTNQTNVKLSPWPNHAPRHRRTLRQPIKWTGRSSSITGKNFMLPPLRLSSKSVNG